MNSSPRSTALTTLLFFFASGLLAFGQSGNTSAEPADQPSAPAQRPASTITHDHPDELKQELDADAIALSRIPADPLIHPDPVAPILRPINMLVDHSIQSLRLKFGATYTVLNQYAAVTPDGVRHDQPSGRLDFTGAWAVYDHESTAGSISLLVRSGTNIGMSQQFNLSDQLGSGLYLNCLQGGGPQEPITLNILYWRQDFLSKRLSFYVGKIHPNQYVTLSMFNNDERSQFLNGANDGNPEGSASRPGPERPSKMNTDSGWPMFIHSDAGETCSAPHSITVSRTPLRNTMRVCLSRFIGFV